MSLTLIPRFGFSEQSEWLRAFLADPPETDRSTAAERLLHSTVGSLYFEGEVRLAVLVAWLSIIRRDVIGDDAMCTVQSILRSELIHYRPDLRAACLELPSRAGEGVR